MTDVIKIVAIGFVGGLLSIYVKKQSPEFAIQIGLVTGLIIFALVIDYLIIAVDFIKQISNKYNIPFEYLNIVLKVVGIAYLSEFAVSILKDAGESSVAAKVEIGTKIIIVVISLPLFKVFFDMIFGLIN